MALTMWGIFGIALVLAVYAARLTMTERPFTRALFYGVAALEVLLIAQLVGGCIALAHTSRDVNGFLFVTQLVLMVVVPVVAVVWAAAYDEGDGSGVDTGAVFLAMVLVALLCLGLLDQWSGVTEWKFPGVEPVLDAHGTTATDGPVPTA